MAAGLFPTWLARAMGVYRAHKRARIQDEVSQGIPFQDKVVKSSNAESAPQPLSLNNLQGPFLLLGAGALLALLVLAAEAATAPRAQKGKTKEMGTNAGRLMAVKSA